MLNEDLLYFKQLKIRDHALYLITIPCVFIRYYRNHWVENKTAIHLTAIKCLLHHSTSTFESIGPEVSDCYANVIFFFPDQQ